MDQPLPHPTAALPTPANGSPGSRRDALRRLTALCAAWSLVACGGGGGGETPPPSPPPPSPPPPSPPPPAPPPPAPPPPSPGPLRTLVLNDTLASPWGLAFLPDGRMLITQKGGSMVILSADGANKTSVTGVPAVNASGQGGLLDVALDPDFATDPWVYFSYAESGTAVARARLVGNALQNVSVIFQQLPKVGGNGHYGSRLVFRRDKTLFVTLGERQLKTPAQDLGGHLGKVVRIHRDGTVPTDNPASLKTGGLTQLWSYGHRNPQGAALHPTTGELWLTEHGPQGGDELNRVLPGNNYGWPLVSYGCEYGTTTPNCEIGGGTHAPTYTEPVSRWPEPSVPTPNASIAPAGLMFYTGDKFPEWQGHAFAGALAGTALWRIALSGNTETGRERLLGSLGQRIRDVRQGPDGWIYVLTDGGQLIRLYR